MANLRTYRTPALILKRRDFGEADRLVTLFAPQYGKFDAIAKGARKPASRKTGHVELFTRADVLIATGSIDILTQAEVQQMYLPIREDLMRGAYASYAAELLDRFTVTGEDSASGDLFDLLDTTFANLCTDADPRRVIRYYEVHLLDILGFRPELQECVMTHEAIQALDQYFSYEGGGVVSPAGALQGANLVPLPMMTLKLLRHLQRSEYRQVAQLQISEILHSDAERILLGYLSFLLERRVESIDFIRKIRQFKPS